MNLSNDVQFLYTFKSKFTINADYERLSVETEFNNSTCLNHHDQSFWLLVYHPLIMSWLIWRQISNETLTCRWSTFWIS